MNNFTADQVAAEVEGARTRLAACGIPSSDIQGFRQPFLQSSPTVRGVLQRGGFKYDSSLLEVAAGASLSDGPAARVWPYTLQDGIPQNCAW